jgi:hypothetical protein
MLRIQPLCAGTGYICWYVYSTTVRELLIPALWRDKRAVNYLITFLSLALSHPSCFLFSPLMFLFDSFHILIFPFSLYFFKKKKRKKTGHWWCEWSRGLLVPFLLFCLNTIVFATIFWNTPHFEGVSGTKIYTYMVLFYIYLIYTHNYATRLWYGTLIVTSQRFVSMDLPFIAKIVHHPMVWIITSPVPWTVSNVDTAHGFLDVTSYHNKHVNIRAYM